MSISRRGFFLSGAAAAAAAAVPTTSHAADEAKIPPGGKPGAVLKISSQLAVIPGKDLQEKLANLEKWGFDGVELGGDVVGNEKKYEDAIKKTKLTASALCGGYRCANGDIVSDVVEKRAPAVASIKEVLTSAGALHLTGVIGLPAFNGQTNLGNQEIRKILLDTMPEIGEHAAKVGTRFILEPLNRKEAYFLRQVADAASIVRDCISPGLAVMGDFYHMFFEETSDLGAFISGGPYVHHVHMASAPERKLPGQDSDDARRYVDGFRGLKWIGYQDFCSLECGVKGNPEEEIPKAVKFLRDQWAKA
jgi:sugar phosphate isomerase/epimerase